MKLELTLPSQAKSGLNTDLGLSSSAQRNAGKGKNPSFLQILRPKTGMKANAVPPSGKALAVAGRPVAVGQGESKAKATGTALNDAVPTGSKKESRKALNKLYGDIAARAGQAQKKTKKQSKDYSVPTVPLGQALEQAPSKAAVLSLKTQPGIVSGNLAKPTLLNVASGQAEKGSRISTARGSSTPITNETAIGNLKNGAVNAANKENNPLSTGKIVEKTKTSTHLPSVGRIPGNRVADAETEKVQNFIAAIPKTESKSGGDGSCVNEGSKGTNPSVDGVVNEGRKILGKTNDTRVGIPVSERRTKATTTTQVSLPSPITVKGSISPNGKFQPTSLTRSRDIHNTVSNPGEQNRSLVTTTKPQLATLGIIAQPKRNENTTPLGQARGGGSSLARFNESMVDTRSEEIKLPSSEGGLKHGSHKTQAQLKSQLPQNPQQLHKNNLPQPSKSLSGGVGNKHDALAQSDNQNPLSIKQTIKGDLFHRENSVTSKASVPTSLERILTNNRSSAPNTPYPVRETHRRTNGLTVQKTEGHSLHSISTQHTAYQTVAALKTLSVSKVLLPVSTGEKQKKTAAIKSKPAKRHRELTHTAIAKKPAKSSIAHAKAEKGVTKAVAGGMEDAFLKLDMNLARRMEQPGNPRQNLPYGDLIASKEVRNHASVAAEMIEAGRSDLSHIKDFTIRNDFANRLNQADVELQSLQAKSTQSKGQTSVNAIVYRQVMSAVETFRGMRTSRWAMTIEPSHDLRIQLDLRMSDSQLVVQAKLERGAQAVLGSGWSELQASLAEKDVDLRSLITANPKEGHSDMFSGKNGRQSGGAKQDDESWFSEELSELLAEFEKEAQEPGKAKRNRRKARMAETNFESWA
ncbi:MAG: hypothetical protein H8E20_08505 [Verrucomicrobia bacterium]|nr:hypothetical protein [Verrucomicrobiota bacterium]